MTYSQNGEEAIIDNILSNCGKSTEFFVELGAGDGYHLSNGRNFIERGWKGIMIDADNRGNEEVKQHKITRENVNELLELHNCPKEFDFLSIDLDGNDYWILEKILSEYRPKLVIAEFNASFPIEESKSIKYDPKFSWEGDTYFGFTLKAGIKLAEKCGYKAILQHADMNLFMLRKDYAKKIDSKIINYNQSDYFKKSDRTDWENI
jgi:hypothetical protein